MSIKSISEQMDDKEWSTFTSALYKDKSYYSHSRQKRFRDSKGTKYFITCDVNNWEQFQETCPALPAYSYTFHTQFTTDTNLSVNIETVSWKFEEDKYLNHVSNLVEIEEMFEKMWLTYGEHYYELNDV